jgi:hypothetical protein
MKKSQVFIEFRFIWLNSLKSVQCRKLIHFYFRHPFCRTLDSAAQGSRTAHPPLSTPLGTAVVLHNLPNPCFLDNTLCNNIANEHLFNRVNFTGALRSREVRLQKYLTDKRASISIPSYQLE